MYPDLKTAEEELAIAGKMNPGPWIKHSINTARACSFIAERCANMDPAKAYVLGLLHDIGRRVGICQEKHMAAGYQFCMGKGWDDQARICISHSFMIPDIKTTLGKWDVSADEYRMVEKFLETAQYDDYDRLVQLCDSLAVATGFCLLEKRFVDVSLRYGVNDRVVDRWKAVFALKDYFEKMIGCPVYDILPGVRENTFSGTMI